MKADLQTVDCMDAEEGRLLVRLARKTVENYLKREELPDAKTGGDEKRGVFVSIHSFPSRELRGCIGFPLPAYPLREAVQKAALSAAFADSRFHALTLEELPRVVFEVSALSVPKQIESQPEAFEIGVDGLIIEHRGHSGLLLPQVPVEFGWLPVEFLEQLCLKARLPRNAWKQDGVILKSFQADVFEEQEPDGDVIRKPL